MKFVNQGPRIGFLSFEFEEVVNLLVVVNIPIHNDCDISAVVEKLHYLFSFSR